MNERYQRILDGLNEFQRAWVNLDFKLTRLPDGSRDEEKMEDILQQIHHMPKNIVELINQPGGNPLYYLSDGGYSRVVWSTDTGNLWLTDNSSSRAKAAWPDAQHERRYLQQLLQRDYQEALASERGEPDAQGHTTVTEARQMVQKRLESAAAADAVRTLAGLEPVHLKSTRSQ